LIEAKSQRRWLNAAGVAAVVAALMGYAFYAQYGRWARAVPALQLSTRRDDRARCRVSRSPRCTRRGHECAHLRCARRARRGIAASAFRHGTCTIQNLPPDKVPACGLASTT
jgi:hypothetical protein